MRAVQTLFQIAKQPEKSIDEALYFSVAGLSLEEIDPNENPLTKFIAEDIEFFDEEHEMIKSTEKFMRSLVKGTLENEEAIDRIIEKNLHHWKIERVDLINLVILRMATFEIASASIVDKVIIMNEAVEMTKLFNDEKASKFVNGVLQGIVDNIGA